MKVSSVYAVKIFIDLICTITDLKNNLAAIAVMKSS